MSVLNREQAKVLISNGGGEVTIPDAVDEIAKKAFAGSGVTGITFGAQSKLKIIGESAFCDCKQLTGTVAIPDSVEQIPDYVFDGSGVTGITFGPQSKLKNIGDQAFSECAQLSTMEIPLSINDIAEGAFKGVPFDTIKLITV